MLPRQSGHNDNTNVDNLIIFSGHYCTRPVIIEYIKRVYLIQCTHYTFNTRYTRYTRPQRGDNIVIIRGQYRELTNEKHTELIQILRLGPCFLYFLRFNFRWA